MKIKKSKREPVFLDSKFRYISLLLWEQLHSFLHFRRLANFLILKKLTR